MSKEYKEWLRRAQSSLNLSKVTSENEICYEDLCFQAQQAAEKSLKALLIFYNEEPSRTHSLNILLNKLKDKIDIPEGIEDVIDLNDYSVQIRYPGDYTPVEYDEYIKAVNIAENVINWVYSITKS